MRVLMTHHGALADQIAELTVAQQEMARQLKAGSARVETIEAKLDTNTEVTTEVRDFLAAFKGGFKVLGWLGVGAKWVGGMAGAAAAVYTAWYMLTHGGQMPPGPK